MRILLVSTAFSGLTQRFYTELSDADHEVSVELHLGDEARLLEGVELFQPELILCPFLTRRIPVEIYRRYKCLIVHPGIKGDRGPSSLDWAIQEGLQEWGVTLLEADAEMDAGPIWASKTFPLSQASKSSIFNREVTQAAVDCLWEALSYANAPSFKPQPLDYADPTIQGRLRPAMKQADRTIDWQRHSSAEIVRRIHAADGSPGVLDQIDGQAYYLYNAASEPTLRGKPGAIIAVAEQAICRASVDGAVWIGHLKPKQADGKVIKLPALLALGGSIPQTRKYTDKLFGSASKTLSIDYSAPGRQFPLQEVWYELEGDIAYLYFAFHNGGMSTAQCRLLLRVYRHLASLNIKAIVLMGGADFWSNGIHLNHIEAATEPADESWLNINAIDDLVRQIILTPDKLTIAAVAGNAGAGGAILALAADRVLARHGVVFNPHYRNMGGLYGSEYWTYLLPRRVGPEAAERLTEACLPISANQAWQLGMVDQVLDGQQALFAAQVKHLAQRQVANDRQLLEVLQSKAARRCRDEAEKPLARYRQKELTHMYENFYGTADYHAARQAFVFKQAASDTPRTIAKHRQTDAKSQITRQEQLRVISAGKPRKTATLQNS